MFELTNALHNTGEPDGPVDWVLCRADDDPETLWEFEFYRDQASFARHFANPEIDKNHDEVIELLAETPLRVVVHPFASSSDAKNASEGIGMRWQPTWTQAMTDFRGEDDEPPFDNVTVRMTVPVSIGGSHVRAELSNRFGDEPVLIGRGAIKVGDESFDIAFDGRPTTEIPAGESRWTDPIELNVHHGDEIVIDLYLPEPTPYATAAGFMFNRSMPGDSDLLE
ncbi:MAG: putative quinol monooxygenase [Dermatophilaceae bacterium]